MSTEAAVGRFDEEELDAIYDEVLGVYSIEQVTTELLLPALIQVRLAAAHEMRCWVHKSTSGHAWPTCRSM